MAGRAWSLSSASRISAIARRAAGWADLGRALRTLAALWTQQRASAVTWEHVGRSAALLPNAPSPAATGRHTPAAQAPQYIRTGLRRLAVAVRYGHQFLGAIGAHPTMARAHKRASSRRTLKCTPSARHVFHLGQTAPAEPLVLVLPLGGEPGDHRW